MPLNVVATQPRARDGTFPENEARLARRNTDNADGAEGAGMGRDTAASTKKDYPEKLYPNQQVSNGSELHTPMLAQGT